MAFDAGSFYKSGKAPRTSSGPVKNPNTSTWNPGTGGVPRPGGYPSQGAAPAVNPDPFNWKQIAADLKAEEDRKAQAKTRVQQQQQQITNPSAPRALQAQAPGRTPESDAAAISAWQQMEAFMAMNNGALPPGVTPQAVEELRMNAGIAQSPMNPTPKQQLDAYRAMNGGALPPGMTPEQAAAIDAAPVPGVTGPLDPALAPIIAQFQALLSGLPGEYAAGKASVAGSYNNLTGDVLSSGKNWMQDLYGRIADPNDPNAALAAQDPALAAYGQSMSEIDETADLNQATDLAWFDKMQANAASTYQGLIATLMAQAPPVVEEEGGGGGGGGGGGRRGYGGGGSGGGNVNNWKTPTNTLTNQTSATDTATQTDTGYSPGFYEALMEATSSDPDLQALTQRIWEGSSQDARGMTQETSKRLTEAELALENADLQKGQHQAWFQNTPNLSKAAINQMLQNKGAVLGDDPATKNVRERYYVPRQEGGNVPTVVVQTPEQAEQNALGEALIANRSPTATSRAIEKMLYKPGKAPERRMPVGVLSPAGQLEWQTQGAISPAQIKLLAQHGQRGLTEAQKGDTPEQKFNWKSWAEGGGFVPEADPKAREDTSRNIDMYNYILDTILPWNPNATIVPTREQMVSQGKDSSTYNSKTTNKSWANANPGSPIDLTPALPTPALQANPMSNPAGFDITLDDQGDETVEVSNLGLGFGEGIRPTADTKKMDALADIAFGRDEIKGKALSRFGWGGAKRPVKKTPAPKKAAEPVKPEAFVRNKTLKRPKMTTAAKPETFTRNKSTIPTPKAPAKKWELKGITDLKPKKKTSSKPSTIYGRRH